jgi:hypothetical protein
MKISPGCLLLSLLLTPPLCAETWSAPEVGVRVPLPEGWVETGSGSRKRVLTRVDDPHEDFRDSIRLAFRPRDARLEPQELIGPLTALLRQQGCEVKRGELVERAGRRVAWVDSLQTQGPARYLTQQILLPQDEGIVVLFGASAPARAAEIRGTLEQMLDGLELIERRGTEDDVFAMHAGARIPRTLDGKPLFYARLARNHVLFGYAADARKPLLLADARPAQGALADQLSALEYVTRVEPAELSFEGLPARAAALELPNGDRHFALGVLRGRLLWVLRAPQARDLGQAQAVWTQLEADLEFVAPSDPSLQLDLQAPLRTAPGLSLRLPAPFRLARRQGSAVIFQVIDFRVFTDQLTLQVQDLGQAGETGTIAKRLAERVAKIPELEWTPLEAGRYPAQISASFQDAKGQTMNMAVLTTPGGRSYQFVQLVASKDPEVIERYLELLRALLETASVN